MGVVDEKLLLDFLKKNPDRILQKNSLSLLLLIVKQSQTALCRRNYYRICYFFSILQKVEERCFLWTQADWWKFSALCVIDNLDEFLYTMEYHLMGIV